MANSQKIWIRSQFISLFIVGLFALLLPLGVNGLSHASDTSCLSQCEEEALWLMTQCTDAGKDELSCAVEASRWLNQCSDEGCFQPDTCSVACEAEAEAFRLNCDLGDLDCEYEAQSLFEGCLESRCEREALSCESQCENEGLRVFDACVDAGNDEEICADKARATWLSCDERCTQ